MAKPAATAPLTMALLALLLSVSLHLQAQAAAGHGAAEYVLLEPRPERLLLAAAATGNATNNQVCGSCKCCLKNTNPQVCLTTCCFEKTCAGSVCSLRSVSCGCNPCDYPAGGAK